MLKIAIIGCGYVGQALASRWKSLGHHITGTTRSFDKLGNILKHCQKAEVLHSTDADKLSQIVNENDVIALTVAADNPEDYENVYLRTAQNLKNCAKNSPLKSLLYTSSTFVYGDHNGKWVDESSSLLNETEPGRILIETEKTLTSLQDLGWNVLVFRLSEIYGPNRNLSEKVKKYQGSILSGQGDNYTNMVHLDDIVEAYTYALNHRLRGIYNLSDDEHTIRSELYKQISDRFGFKPIKWDPSVKTLRSGNKRVSNHKIKSVGYTFIHPKRIID